jgi:hypothetical protein
MLRFEVVSSDLGLGDAFDEDLDVLDGQKLLVEVDDGAVDLGDGLLQPREEDADVVRAGGLQDMRVFLCLRRGSL